MEPINHSNLTESLLLEQLRYQLGNGDSNDTVITEIITTVVVSFPRYSFESNTIPTVITDINKTRVKWSDNQENKGYLIYGVEFTLTEDNTILLTDGTNGTIDWSPTVEANFLGLLNVTIQIGR